MSNCRTDKPTLFVCWQNPEVLPDEDVVILSFLSPEAEDTLKNAFQGKLISAREVAPNVKDKAIKTYLGLVAEIGATPIKAKNGQTLRQALKNKDGVSAWWFHKVSEKDCESDDTFNLIIEVLTIAQAADLVHSKEIQIFKGKNEISNALRSAYGVIEVEPSVSSSSFSKDIIKGLLSRLEYAGKFLWKWIAIKRTLKNHPQRPFDVVFAGFWDWSVKHDEGAYGLIDRFFKSLPQKLSEVSRVGWFLWFDPYFEPTPNRPKLKEVLGRLKSHDNLVVLQDFISLRDLAKAVSNLKPLFIFHSFYKEQEFQDILIKDGMDFSLLIKPKLYSGFSNFMIPHHELIYLANLRAFDKYKPKLSVSFLELFLHSRSLYQAAQNSHESITNCAVQHASYSREKTFALLDSAIEYKGEPDNCPMPKPDYIFAMGELGKDIFMESGFPEERVFLTGSTRYEHVISDTIKKDKPANPAKILLVTSLDRDHEMEMVEAVYLATKDLPAIQLHLRSHPFAKMDEYFLFQKYKDRIHVVDRTLEEDLQQADLIVFTYTTVAEEALIRGVPVWQWCSTVYNASVFRDIEAVPQFYSVDDLKNALWAFMDDPQTYVPKDEIRDVVLKKCFYKSDGKASQRVAGKILSILGTIKE